MWFQQIKDLKTTSIVKINKIATDTSADIIDHLINVKVNQSNVSAIVSDVVKKRIGKST